MALSEDERATQLLQQLAPGVPRQVALVCGVSQQWEHCRRLRTEARIAFARHTCAKLHAFQYLTASQHFRMLTAARVGEAVLTDEIVLRILRFSIADQVMLDMPPGLGWPRLVSDSHHERWLVDIIVGDAGASCAEMALGS